MGCQGVVFFATEKPTHVTPIILEPGIAWHLHDDTRWPPVSPWLEFNTGPMSPGWGGVMVVTPNVPEDEADLFSWAVYEAPMGSELASFAEIVLATFGAFWRFFFRLFSPIRSELDERAFSPRHR